MAIKANVNSTPTSRRARGFTLVEILLAIGIVGLLVGLSLPAIQYAREAGRRTHCLNNLRQIGLALHAHHDIHGCIPPRPLSGQPDDPNKLLHWTAIILPQMDQQPLWSISEQACRIDHYSNHDPPHVGHSTVVRSYVCPSDSRPSTPLTMSTGELAAFASYLGVAGSPNGGDYSVEPSGAISFVPAPGMFPSDGLGGSRMSEVTDGLSQTLMAGERPPPAQLQAGRWYSRFGYGGPFPGPDGILHIPAASYLLGDPCLASADGFGPGRSDNPCDRHHFWSLHSGGGNFLIADASTRYFSYSAAPIMYALATRSGEESIDLP